MRPQDCGPGLQLIPPLHPPFNHGTNPQSLPDFGLSSAVAQAMVKYISALPCCLEHLILPISGLKTTGRLWGIWLMGCLPGFTQATCIVP